MGKILDEWIRYIANFLIYVTIACMNESYLTSRGQVTIPRDVRRALGLVEGDRVAFVPDGHLVLLFPIKGDILSLKGALKRSHKGGAIDFKKLREKVSEKWARERGREWGSQTMTLLDTNLLI